MGYSKFEPNTQSPAAWARSNTYPRQQSGAQPSGKTMETPPVAAWHGYEVDGYNSHGYEPAPRPTESVQPQKYTYQWVRETDAKLSALVRARVAHTNRLNIEQPNRGLAGSLPLAMRTPRAQAPVELRAPAFTDGGRIDDDDYDATPAATVPQRSTPPAKPFVAPVKAEVPTQVAAPMQVAAPTTFEPRRSTRRPVQPAPRPAGLPPPGAFMPRDSGPPRGPAPVVQRPAGPPPVVSQPNAGVSAARPPKAPALNSWGLMQPPSPPSFSVPAPVPSNTYTQGPVSSFQQVAPYGQRQNFVPAPPADVESTIPMLKWFSIAADLRETPPHALHEKVTSALNKSFKRGKACLLALPLAKESRDEVLGLLQHCACRITLENDSQVVRAEQR